MTDLPVKGSAWNSSPMALAPHTRTRPADPDDAAGLTVRRITPGEAQGARRAIRSWMDRVCAGGTPLDQLYGGFDPGGALSAAAILVPQPGRTGLIFAAPPSCGPEVSALGQVLRACCDRAPRQQVTLAQALLSPSERREAKALAQAGFEKLARLAYMQARIPRSPVAPPPPAGVELRPYDPTLHNQFIAALESTYEQTRDCPGLRGLRRTDDVLQGHRGVGLFDASLWTLVRIGGRPAGVVLLNRVPASGSVELVYLGVAPEHRRKGLGATLLQRAICQCAQRGESYMTLAVDTANAPAMALYRRWSFRRTATRDVWILPLAQKPRH